MEQTQAESDKVAIEAAELLKDTFVKIDHYKHQAPQLTKEELFHHRVLVVICTVNWISSLLLAILLWFTFYIAVVHPPLIEHQWWAISVFALPLSLTSLTTLFMINQRVH